MATVILGKYGSQEMQQVYPFANIKLNENDRYALINCDLKLFPNTSTDEMYSPFEKYDIVSHKKEAGKLWVLQKEVKQSKFIGMEKVGNDYMAVFINVRL